MKTKKTLKIGVTGVRLRFHGAPWLDPFHFIPQQINDATDDRRRTRNAAITAAYSSTILAHVQGSVARAADAPNWRRDLAPAHRWRPRG